MKQQQKTYWCGPASIQNALRLLGRKVSQRKIAELCGTTEEGTDEFQIMRGLTALGYGYDILNTDSPAEAMYFLSKCSPVLLCVNAPGDKGEMEPWMHWVTLVGRTNYRWLYIDPARYKPNLAEHLTHVVSWSMLESRWRAHAKYHTDPGDRAFYGIAVINP